MRTHKRHISLFSAVLAMLAIMSAGCTRIEEQTRQEDAAGVILYDLASASSEGVKSSIEESRELGAITLTSADGSYSLTLTGRAAPTSDCREEAAAEATKAAPVTSTNIESRYNDGSIQILALKDRTSEAYIPQQKLVFANRESGSSTSRWKTVTDYTWPAEALEFWSWAPYSGSASAGKLSDASVSGGSLTFSYECPSSASEGKVAEAQSDVLLAYNRHSSSDKGNVSLMYKHALSAVCFKVDRANKCTVKSVSLSNVYSKGNCSFDGSSISWSGQSERKAYTETFNTPIDEYLKDDYGNPQALDKSTDGDKTFLLVPQSATSEQKITLTMIVRLDGAAEDLTLSAELDPGDCIWLPGWTYTYSAEFEECDYEFKLTNAEQSNLIYTNTDNDSDQTIVPVTSNKISVLGTYDAEWDIASYTIGGVTTEVTDNQFTDGGLTVIKDGKNVNITALARKTEGLGSNDYWVNTEGRTDHLEWSPASWSDKGIVDLSKYNFQNESTNNPMTTANCYVIRHAGTYKLPLVYGNAVQNGTVHTETYYPNVTGGKYRLSNFLNHKGKSLKVENDAFIENNDGCGGSDLKCAVIWQDQGVVLTNLTLDAYSEIGGSYNTGNVRYLNFEVPQSNICQNNALICIYKDLNSNNKYDEGEAVWSWHIWTTNDPALIGNPIIVTNQTPQKYGFFPINCLGWIEPINYSERTTLKLLLKQKISNNIIEIEVNQPIVRGSSFGTLYQFGRKDPIPGKELDKLVSGSIFNKNGAGRVTLQVAIGNPATFYHTPNTSGTHDWCYSTYYNLWTGKLSASANEDDSNLNIKTIYDPSPAGYKVPASKAFSIFTTENAEGGFNSGWNFYCDNTKANTIFFPAIRMRNGDSEHDGSLTNPGEFGVFWASMLFNESNSYCLSFSNSSSAVRSSDRCTGYGVRPVIE